MKVGHGEGGQALLLTVVCMTVLLGLTAFATDAGVLLYQRREAQTAADCAAMAGVEEENYLSADSTTVTATARAAAAANGFTNGSNGVTVTVNDPPLGGAHVGASNYVEVIVEQSVPTIFMGLFGFSSQTISARAVGGFGSTQGCLYTLSTSGTDYSDSGPGTVSMPGCTVYDNSSSNQAMVLNNSGLTAGTINIVGDYSGTGISPTPKTGTAVVSDPLAFLQAPTVPSGCNTNESFNQSGTYSLGLNEASNGVSYGCYGSLTVNNSTLNLASGLYIINGNLTFNNSNSVINGTGVTFYITNNGSVNINAATVNLTAPTSGTWNGILFFQARNDNQQFNFTGPTADNLQGIIYIPDATLKWTNGGADVDAEIVVNQLQLTGPATINNYDLVNVANPLAQPRLVE